MATTIVINEQHSLLPAQERLLPAEYETLRVPATGWDKEEMDAVMTSLRGEVIFVSPIPYMLIELAFSAGADWSANATSQEYPFAVGGDYRVRKVRVFCNDTREKKELPNGKVIQVTTQEGWYLA